jgi:hypothetical protein
MLDKESRGEGGGGAGLSASAGKANIFLTSIFAQLI